jgi:hypothetical protein
MIKNKYKKEDRELLESIKDLNRAAVILEIKLVGTSKVKDNLIYECTYLVGKTEMTISIIAHDVTQALAKLEPFTNSGIPESVLKYMLGSERYS